MGRLAPAHAPGVTTNSDCPTGDGDSMRTTARPAASAQARRVAGDVATLGAQAMRVTTASSHAGRICCRCTGIAGSRNETTPRPPGLEDPAQFLEVGARVRFVEMRDHREHRDDVGALIRGGNRGGRNELEAPVRTSGVHAGMLEQGRGHVDPEIAQVGPVAQRRGQPAGAAADINH